MVEKASFDRVMENLILKSLKKNYAQSPQRYAKRMLSGNMNMGMIWWLSTTSSHPISCAVLLTVVNLPLISVSDMNKFPVAKFVAWVFGRRPNPCNPVLDYCSTCMHLPCIVLTSTVWCRTCTSDSLEPNT